MVDKKKGIPKGKGLPMIGKPKKTEIQEAIQQLVQYLDPIIGGMGQQIEAMDRRLGVLEEMVSATIVDILAKKVEAKLKTEPVKMIPYEQAKLMGLVKKPKKEKK